MGRMLKYCALGARSVKTNAHLLCRETRGAVFHRRRMSLSHNALWDDGSYGPALALCPSTPETSALTGAPGPDGGAPGWVGRSTKEHGGNP